jgi:hypothetical protein
MAAIARTCVNCGEDFIAPRVDKPTCSARCKKIVQRERENSWPAGFKEAERVLVDRIAARQEDPVEALARIVGAWIRWTL